MTIGRGTLLTVDGDFRLLLVEQDERTVSDLIASWSAWGLTVRRVRGSKMRAWEGLFDEFSAAWQFPWYFGENVDAFAECLGYLGWLPSESGYVIVISGPATVLADADATSLSTLVSVLADASAEWSRPVEQGEWWDRPTVPFHVVMQAAPGDAAAVAQRWTDAGGVVARLPT